TVTILAPRCHPGKSATCYHPGHASPNAVQWVDRAQGRDVRFPLSWNAPTPPCRSQLAQLDLHARPNQDQGMSMGGREALERDVLAPERPREPGLDWVPGLVVADSD